MCAKGVQTGHYHLTSESGGRPAISFLIANRTGQNPYGKFFIARQSRMER